jgi:hypothetical protein
MSKALWACCTCGEDFTRKFSAYRHRENVHSGKSTIIRFVEYLAGLASGLYPYPIIPPRLSGNRRPKFLKSRTDGQISSTKADKTIADSTRGNLWLQQRNAVSDNNFYRHNNPNKSSLQNNANDEMFSTLDYAIEWSQKMLRFNTIMNQLSPKPYLHNFYMPSTWTLNPIINPISNPTNPTPTTFTNPTPTTFTNPTPTTFTNPLTETKTVGLRGELCTKCCSSKITKILSFDILEPLVRLITYVNLKITLCYKTCQIVQRLEKIAIYHL